MAAELDYSALTDRIAELLREDGRLRDVYITTELIPQSAERMPAVLVSLVRADREPFQIAAPYPTGSPDRLTIRFILAVWTFSAQSVADGLTQRNDVVRRVVNVLRDNIQPRGDILTFLVTGIDFTSQRNEETGSVYGHAQITCEAVALN